MEGSGVTATLSAASRCVSAPLSLRGVCTISAVVGALAIGGIAAQQYEQLTESVLSVSARGGFVPFTAANSIMIAELAPAAPPTADAPVTALHLMMPDTKTLMTALDSNEFRLVSVRHGAPVPRVFVAAMPQDMGAITSLETKRSAFIRTVLPLILTANERIAAERTYVRELRLRWELGRRPSPADQAWLTALVQRYKVRDGDWDALLERVDEIPVSLALAQTILESGWGGSVVARRNNSLFGMIGGDGTDPARHAMHASLLESVSSYAHNLNIHPAYAAFRKVRARMRAESRALESHQLAATLLPYSELGAEYTRMVQALIAKEELIAFDNARLVAEAE